MHIQKYKKDKTNKYKVYIDDDEFIIYDDVIIKYNLLCKKEITEEELQEVLKTNDEYTSYYLCIRYINTKIRSEKEIKEYLKKKEISNEIIHKTIDRLKHNSFINDEIYAKSYINDKINLSYEGPKKIKDALIKNNIDDKIIIVYLDKITYDVWIDRINKYIDKKKKINHASESIFKKHMLSDLHNLGYSSDMINECINCIKIEDHDDLVKEYNKVKTKLEKKYSDNELKYKIKQKLYSKGYRIEDIEGVINED